MHPPAPPPSDPPSAPPRPRARQGRAWLVVALASIAALIALDGATQWIRSYRLRRALPAVFRSPKPLRTSPVEDPASPVASPGTNPAVSPFAPALTLPQRPPNARPPVADELFAGAEVVRLEIQITPANVRQLSRKPRDYVAATVREGVRVYTNVAVHLKGGPGSFRSFDDRPSLTLNFDKFAEGQTFHGLKKLHLNSSVQDSSYLSEKICRELFDAAGVPTPQAGHAILQLNERDMGLYVLIEGINKQFLKRYFPNAKGNVYDGHSGSDVTMTMPVNSGDNPKDNRGREALANAVRISDPAARWTAIQKTLDVDRFLSFVAMESMLGHWDGYTIGQNNFRIFHDLDADRMVFLPQGLDQVLSQSESPMIPRLHGLVARAVLEIPEARERYEQRFAELTAQVFQPDAIAQRLRDVSERVQAAVAESNPTAASALAQKTRSLTRRFQKRSDFLRRQLFPANTLTLGTSEALPLPAWQSQTDLGQAALLQERADDGTSVLRIATTNGCTASWRTTVALDPGKYRLEARLRTRGVLFPEDDPRAGAGLRVSRHRVGQKNSGDRPWTPVTFNFDITADKPEIELICELRALRGEVDFDQTSLRVVRR